jgi:hypothetical protein
MDCMCMYGLLVETGSDSVFDGAVLLLEGSAPSKHVKDYMAMSVNKFII